MPCACNFYVFFDAWKVLAEMLHRQWENSSSLKNFVILLKFQIFVYVIGQNLVNPMSFRSMPNLFQNSNWSLFCGFGYSMNFAMLEN